MTHDPTRPKNIHAQALGRLGGAVKNPKRAAASRRNGLLGGRPKKHGDAPPPATKTRKPHDIDWAF